ncbi:hypothetical protein G9A89_023019 [Geosiphon pyriformis]|nr:hypothetical protein G9A89_023019 [Geosiphon pyriformis]
MKDKKPCIESTMMPHLSPRFPPDVTPMDLLQKSIQNLKTTGKSSRVPNGFIAYRMAICKELRGKKHPVITQPKLSTIVKQGWSREPEHIRKEYQKIATEARNLYKQICHDHLLIHETESQENISSKNEIITYPLIDSIRNYTQTRESLDEFKILNNDFDKIQPYEETWIYPYIKKSMDITPTTTTTTTTTPAINIIPTTITPTTSTTTTTTTTTTNTTSTDPTITTTTTTTSNPTITTTIDTITDPITITDATTPIIRSPIYIDTFYTSNPSEFQKEFFIDEFNLSNQNEPCHHEIFSPCLSDNFFSTYFEIKSHHSCDEFLLFTK